MAAKSLVVTGLVLNALLWSSSRYATPESNQFTPQSLQYDQDLHSTFLTRRWENGTSTLSDEPWLQEPLSGKTCKPLTFPVEKQCAHVQRSCPKSKTFLSIQYAQSYFCASPTLKPVYFGGLLLWLVFLFSFIGITASDFFCPNLSTIAKVFGLSDNIAGVTFLAFGNGSPDLFATYSAMRANSGSLAVGELLGAATFIQSVVVGSMCIVTPFHVRRGAFLRDIGFFTAAVALLLYTLIDGKIYFWQGACLICLYVAYVTAVVIGTWWSQRQEKQEERERLMRAEYADEETTTGLAPREYSDDASDYDDGQPHLDIPGNIRPRAGSSPTRPHLQTRMSSLRRLSQSQGLPGSRTSSVSDFGRMAKSYVEPSRSPHDPVLPSFSLIGALEFRSVVDSLERESTAAALNMFSSASTPYAAGHYHRHRTASEHSRHSRRSSRNTILESEVDPWDAALARGEHTDSPDRTGGQRVPLATLNTGSPTRTPVDSIYTASPRSPMHDSSLLTAPNAADGLHAPHQPIMKSAPAIVERVVSTENALVASSEALELESPSRIRRILSEVGHRLFPTLHNLMAPNKSWLGRIAAIFAAPAVLVLTLSLPVAIVSDDDDDDAPEKPYVPEGQLVDIRIDISGPASDEERSQEGSYHQFKQLRNPLPSRYTDDDGGAIDPAREEELEREAESDISSIISDIEKEIHGAHFNKWLMAAQCVCGPLFVTTVLLTRSDRLWIFLLAAFISGLASATLVIIFAKNGNNPIGRIVRSLMGFVVAMVWIMAIADEVVNVLQTFGFIFGLSDAIIGLTVFAIGNSLADFVANLAVARFAPLMGFAACFGAPMLNMLIGIGVSSTVLLHTSNQPYYAIDFSSTLLVSSIGLLALLLTSMIFVPLNGYLLSKRWGVFLICCYVVIMGTNLAVEVKREQ